MITPKCKLCQKMFDLSAHYPLILPKCGHTVCRLCLKSKIQPEKNQFFICSDDQ